jgi:dUTP pyrophosphatase
MQVKIQVLSNDVQIPSKATELSAGFDLRSTVNVTIPPSGKALIPTGLKMAIEPGYEMQVRPRSGLALKNGISVLNSPGTIDADYRGEVGVILINHGTEDFVVNKNDRIAQAVFAAVPQVNIELVDSLDETQRGSGGFGHSGNR